MVKDLPSSGHYVVIFRLRATAVIPTGALGEVPFPPGCYAYAGSALRNLPARVRRHLNPPAPHPRWHIDHLAARAEPLLAIVATATTGRECPIAEFLGHRFRNVPRFGASDCRCPSHLFHDADQARLMKACMDAFLHLGRFPLMVDRRGRVVEEPSSI